MSRSPFFGFLLGCALLAACAAAPEVPHVATGAITPVGWTRQADDVAGFSIAYPKTTLQFGRADTVMTLTHSVPLKHPDPCDFKGDAPALDRLTDMSVSFDVLEKSLKDAIITTEGSDYAIVSSMRGDTIVPSPEGPVEAAVFAGVQGYRILSGVEGCGRAAYYFPTPTGRTLVVLRSLIPEFSPVNAQADSLLQIPGVLLPQDEETLFQAVMDTVLWTNQQTSSAPKA